MHFRYQKVPPSQQTNLSMWPLHLTKRPTCLIMISVAGSRLCVQGKDLLHGLRLVAGVVGVQTDQLVLEWLVLASQDREAILQVLDALGGNISVRGLGH